jgi:hypothetical protein
MVQLQAYAFVTITLLLAGLPVSTTQPATTTHLLDVMLVLETQLATPTSLLVNVQEPATQLVASTPSLDYKLASVTHLDVTTSLLVVVLDITT